MVYRTPYSGGTNMHTFESPIKQYRTSATGELLYECVLCGETTSAANSYIVCPECGGKLKRIKLVDYS